MKGGTRDFQDSEMVPYDTETVNTCRHISVKTYRMDSIKSASYSEAGTLQRTPNFGLSAARHAHTSAVSLVGEGIWELTMLSAQLIY